MCVCGIGGGGGGESGLILIANYISQTRTPPGLRPND